MKKLLLNSMLLLCALIVGSSYAWADNDSYTATSSDKPTATNGTTSGSVTGTNSISWSYSVTQETKSGKSPYVQYSDASGWQLGSGNSPCKAFSISSSGISGTITQIQVVTGSKSASSKIYVTVGGNNFGTQGQSTGSGSTVATQTFTGSASGEIIVSASASNEAFYFKSVTVTYTPSGGGSDPSISASNVNIAQDATNGSIEYTLANGTGNVSASITSGDWLTLGTITASAVPFTCSANTGAQRTATVTLSFTGATDKVVTITQAAKTVATPTFSREGGNYMEGLTFTLTSAGNTIYYTTDGSTPSNTSTEYTAPVAIAAGSKTYKAIAYDTYGNASSVTQRTYKGIAPATLPFSWTGTSTAGKAALGNVTGVAGYSLGTDYAASNAPYRLKFDDTNKNVIIYTDAKPENVYFTAKLLSGKADTGSKIKVQGSDDGITFTDIEEFTIKGAANATFEFTTSNAFAATHRAVKLVMSSKDVNVGVGTICVSCIPISTASGKNYSTYVTAYDLDFSSVSDDIKAYVAASEAEGGKITFTGKDAVPAGTPILVKTTTAGATVNVPVAATTPDAVGTNKLVAGTGSAITYDSSASHFYYILSNGEFRPANNSVVATGKAYLSLDGAAGARGLSIAFDDDETTAIETVVKTQKADGMFFDLQGRRVAQPTKGLYIVNGKKVIVK